MTAPTSTATSHDVEPPRPPATAPDPAPPHRGRPRLPVGPVALALVAVLVVAVAPPQLTRVATLACIYAVAAVGLSVLSGTARIVSLGSAAFLGLGAFVTTVLVAAGWQFPLAVAVGTAACMALGLVLSPVAGRLTGVFLAILTIGVTLSAQHVFRISESWTGGTAGRLVEPPVFAGIQLDRALTLSGVSLSGATVYFAVCALLLIGVAVITSNLLRARTGRALQVLATSPVTARSFGIRPSRYRAFAVVYSSALAGLAGGLLAGYSRFVSYDQFSVELSVQLLAVVVLGGLGSVYGVVVAAGLLVGLPELILRAPDLPFVASAGTQGLTPDQLSAVLYGLALVVVMVAEPGGLAGLTRRLSTATHVRRHPRSAR